MTTYKIAEVAERSGFPASTLRYWEDIGLLSPVTRTGAGYRIYDDADLDRLAFIARAKQLGCTLEEIGNLLTSWLGHECAPVQHGLRTLVAAKIDESQLRIAELTALAVQLQRAATHLAARTPNGPCDATCGCLTETPATPGGLTQRVELTRRPTQTPIACTLGAETMTGRLAAWQGLLASVVDRTAVPEGLRLTFASTTDAADIARLAAAEQDCCAFFDFALTVDHRGTALEVRAPADATDVLTSLFGIAT